MSTLKKINLFNLAICSTIMKQIKLTLRKYKYHQKNQQYTQFSCVLVIGWDAFLCHALDKAFFFRSICSTIMKEINQKCEVCHAKRDANSYDFIFKENGIPRRSCSKCLKI